MTGSSSDEVAWMLKALAVDPDVQADPAAASAFQDFIDLQATLAMRLAEREARTGAGDADG